MAHLFPHSHARRTPRAANQTPSHATRRLTLLTPHHLSQAPKQQQQQQQQQQRIQRTISIIAKQRCAFANHSYGTTRLRLVHSGRRLRSILGLGLTSFGRLL